jgi:hypothetical protein
MCDSYSQFDDGFGRHEKAHPASSKDLGTIQSMLQSAGVSELVPMLAMISKILGRAVAAWEQLSAFDAVQIKTFLREQASAL